MGYRSLSRIVNSTADLGPTVAFAEKPGLKWDWGNKQPVWAVWEVGSIDTAGEVAGVAGVAAAAAAAAAGVEYHQKSQGYSSKRLGGVALKPGVEMLAVIAAHLHHEPDLGWQA